MMCSTSRSSRPGARALVLVLVAASASAPALVSIPAHAAPPARPAPSAPPAAPARDGNRAAELALEAGAAFRARKFADAARLFLEAYRLSSRPAQLRNAARAFEEGGMLDEAATHWARYRDHAGLSADERSEADAHVQLIAERKRSAEIMRAAEAARAAAEVASAAAAAARQQVDAVRAAEVGRTTELTTTAPEPASPVVAYALIGTGAAATLTGAVLWFVASGQVSDLDERLAQRDAADRITGITPSELADEVSGINTTRVVSGVLFSAGIAVAASGVLWLLLDEPEAPGGPRISAQPASGPSGLATWAF